MKAFKEYLEQAKSIVEKCETREIFKKCKIVLANFGISSLRDIF